MDKKLFMYVNDCNINLKKENKEITFAGNLGTISKYFGGLDILFFNNSVLLQSKNSYKTFLAILKNMINGVCKGYFIELSFVGLGYKFINLAENIILKLGYSHYLVIKKPKNIIVFGYKNKLIIFGLDLENVNKIGANIRNLKKIDSYKGKGVRYFGEEIKLKIGKQR